jgi:hypothetical protein
MSAKAIHEATGKSMLAKMLPKGSPGSNVECVTVDASTNWDKLYAENSSLFSKVVLRLHLLFVSPVLTPIETCCQARPAHQAPRKAWPREGELGFPWRQRMDSVKNGH